MNPYAVVASRTLTPLSFVWYENCILKLISDQLESIESRMNRSSGRVNPEEFREWNERMLGKHYLDSFHHHPNILVRFVEKKRVIPLAFKKTCRKSLMKLNETYSSISIPIRGHYLFISQIKMRPFE
jgi:hypothetical protein